MLYELSQHLRAAHEEIIDRWMTAVRADEKIPSANRLNQGDLRDHLDQMLRKMRRQLASGLGAAEPGTEPEPEAVEHGALRADQNYRVDELVREIGVLRGCFLAIFSEFLREKRQIETAEFLQVTQIIHRFFDEICTESVAAYVEQREAQAENTAQALRRLNENLERANQNYEDTDSFRRRTLRAVAHDMATPVNALGLGVAYLSESSEPDEREEAKRLVSRTLEHLRSMVDQLLDFGRLDGGMERLSVTDFSAQTVFEYLLGTFEPMADAKDLTLVGEIDLDLGMVRSDQNKVQRIASNLLSNAIKYCDLGEVRLEMRALGETEWVIEVSDTGGGIAPEERERIFAEFQRLPQHAQQPGLGLGLAIVRTLVQRLGGRVSVESEVGIGSRFTVVLPRG
jgi:signal transduction histidine kinase